MRASLESTRARLPQQEQRVHELRSALAMLVGYSPRELLSELDFGDAKLTEIELPGSVALDSDNLFTAPAEMWSVGANLAGPLFDFGRTRSRIESAEAQLAQAEAQYQLAITNGFRDARDALVIYQTSDRRVEAVRRQAEAIEETLELAEL